MVIMDHESTKPAENMLKESSWSNFPLGLLRWKRLSRSQVITRATSSFESVLTTTSADPWPRNVLTNTSWSSRKEHPIVPTHVITRTIPRWRGWTSTTWLCLSPEESNVSSVFFSGLIIQVIQLKWFYSLFVFQFP